MHIFKLLKLLVAIYMYREQKEPVITITKNMLKHNQKIIQNTLAVTDKAIININ